MFLRWKNVWWRTVPRVLEIKEVAGLSGKSTDEPFVLDESTFTFTFSHLADAFIQSDLQLGST